MNEHQLGQTLLVDPKTSFEEIADVLEAIGWTREDSGLAAAPLVKGEPELASWSWHGGKPLIVYTFNPVAKLRVLDVATVPPALRGLIAARLSLLQPGQVVGYLSASAPRQRLLGLWAAQETERIDLIKDVSRLKSDPERVVAEQSESVAQRIQHIAQARMDARASLRLLAESAAPLIERLGDADYVQSLCPTRKDCLRLFDEDLADDIAAGAAKLYREPFTANPGDRYTELESTAAPAGMLRWHNELSNKFPQGYRSIAGWMVPDGIWMTWAVKSPEGGSVRYDGLAWVDDHWIWLPKAFRIVAPLLRDILAPDGAGDSRV